MNDTLSPKDSCRIYPVVLIIGSRALRKAYNVQQQLSQSYIYVDLNDPATYTTCEQNIDAMQLTQGASNLIIEDAQLLPALQELLPKRADNYSSAIITLVQQQATPYHQKLWQFLQHFDSWIMSHTLMPTSNTAASDLEQDNQMGITAILPSFASLKQTLQIDSNV